MNMMDFYNGCDGNIENEARQSARYDNAYEKERHKLSCSSHKDNGYQVSMNDVMATLSRIENKIDNVQNCIDDIAGALDICEKSNGVFILNTNAVKSCCNGIKLTSNIYK